MTEYDTGWWRGFAFALMLIGVLWMLLMWMLDLL
jgi:hypothetical protein